MSWSKKWSALLALASASACGVATKADDVGQSSRAAEYGLLLASSSSADDHSWSAPGELTYLGQPVTWDYTLAINAKEAFKKTAATLDDFRKDLATTKVKIGDKIELGITLHGKTSGSNILLATNLVENAKEGGQTEYWQAKCATVTPELTVIESMIKPSEESSSADEAKTVALPLQLCDFKYALSAKTSEIAAVTAKPALFRDVSYRCHGTNIPSSVHDANILGYGSHNSDIINCKIEHIDRDIAYPAGAKESFQLQLSPYFLVKTGSDNIAWSSPGAFYNITIDNTSLPFGKYEYCYEMTVHLTGKDGINHGLKSLRAISIASDSSDAWYWNPQWTTDNGNTYSNLVQNLPSNTTFEIDLHCRWHDDGHFEVITR